MCCRDSMHDRVRRCFFLITKHRVIEYVNQVIRSLRAHDEYPAVDQERRHAANAALARFCLGSEDSFASSPRIQRLVDALTIDPVTGSNFGKHGALPDITTFAKKRPG